MDFKFSNKAIMHSLVVTDEIYLNCTDMLIN